MRAKKRLNWTAPAVALLAAATFLTACSDDAGTGDAGADAGTSGAALAPDTEYEGPLSELPTSYPDADDGPLTVGYLTANGAVEALSALDRALGVAVENKGGTLVSLDAQAQPDTQVTQMQQLVDRGVDAIVVWPLDAQALNPVIQSATDKDIPVIGVEVNSEVGGDIGAFTSQITVGSDEIGFTAAREMAHVHPDADVAVAGFVVEVPSVSAQTQAMKDWAIEFGLNVVAEVDNQTDDVAGGMSAASGAFAQQPGIEAVLAYNDPTAIGATLAAREAGKTVTAVGINGGSDALEAIEQGRLHATLQFPIDVWAEQLALAAYGAALDPEAELPPTVYPAPLTLVTADTIDDAATFEELVAGMSG